VNRFQRFMVVLIVPAVLGGLVTLAGLGIDYRASSIWGNPPSCVTLIPTREGRDKRRELEIKLADATLQKNRSQKQEEYIALLQEAIKRLGQKEMNNKDCSVRDAANSEAVRLHSQSEFIIFFGLLVTVPLSLLIALILIFRWIWKGGAK
jgi:hypothetical protein